MKSPKSKVQMEKRCNSRITDHESRVTRTVGGRTNPFRRKPKATKGQGCMLRHVADECLRSGTDLPSHSGSSRPATTARATVTIKAAYADGLRPKRHSQAAGCSSPFYNRRLTGRRRPFGYPAFAKVTAWSRVRKWNEQTIDGFGFARTIVPLYARGRLAGPATCRAIIGNSPTQLGAAFGRNQSRQ